MRLRFAFAVVLTVAFAACARQWPDPPAVDQARYRQDYQAWRADQRSLLAQVLPIVGIWPLPQGRQDADRAAQASVELIETSTEDGRQFVMAFDRNHPAATNPPDVESYPLDPKWRVAARFEAIDPPRPVRVPDVRGGFMHFTAVGTLVFRVNGQEMRLTAFGERDSDELFVMFKDPTNQSTTYGGYRIVLPKVVKPGEWTVLDFNLAMNPPCAYSPYTTCPLPPPENKLPVAIEAGLKRLPSAQGYTQGAS
jgi:uncharacterized protein